VLFLTGDCHGDFRRFSTKAFPIQKTLTKEDLVVILGDAGYLWDGSRQDEYWLDWLDAKPFTTLNIGGNHENYDLLEQYPKVPWKGGMAYRLRPSVLHLCRGQIYDLDGHQTFVMGGAESHDMEVILPPGPEQAKARRRLKKQGIPYRVLGESWWPQELPSPLEHGLAWHHLQQAGWSVDLILTHCAPNRIQQQLAPHYPTNELTTFLQLVQDMVSYNRWFCGHYHQSWFSQEDRFQVLYEEIIPFKEGGSHEASI